MSLYTIETNVSPTSLSPSQTVGPALPVKETQIKADNENVTVYVGGANPQVHITGTNAGALSIETPADGIHATAELADGIVTITGLAQVLQGMYLLLIIMQGRLMLRLVYMQHNLKSVLLQQ